MPEYVELECGDSSIPDLYWIRDVNANKMVASGVAKEYALLIVHAVNQVLGAPKDADDAE